MTALLEVRDATVAFGGLKALDEASITIQDGSLCGLIGPNGSGKSTMLGVISRLTGLTSGELLLDGQEYTSVAPNDAASRGIGRTFQTVHLLAGMTVLGNVMLGAGAEAVRSRPALTWLHIPRVLTEESRARKVAVTALERVGMEGHRDAYPLDLPYGLQRRVEIARALAAQPRLLLLDEPTAGMSQSERRDIGDLLRELRDDGLSQILVEHDLAMIHRTCDACFALNFGKVIAQGTPREVADDPGVLEAYIGRKAARAQDAAVEAQNP